MLALYNDLFIIGQRGMDRCTMNSMHPPLQRLIAQCALTMRSIVHHCTMSHCYHCAMSFQRLPLCNTKANVVQCSHFIAGAFPLLSLALFSFSHSPLSYSLTEALKKPYFNSISSK